MITFKMLSRKWEYLATFAFWKAIEKFVFIVDFLLSDPTPTPAPMSECGSFNGHVIDLIPPPPSPKRNENRIILKYKKNGYEGL